MIFVSTCFAVGGTPVFVCAGQRPTVGVRFLLLLQSVPGPTEALSLGSGAGPPAEAQAPAAF